MANCEVFGKEFDLLCWFVKLFDWNRLSRNPWGYGRLIWIDEFRIQRFVFLGFIDFENQRDAADAVKALDGKSVDWEEKENNEEIWFRMICGSRVRVEFSHGRGRSNRGGGGGGGSRSRRRSSSRSPKSKKAFSPRDVCYECGGSLISTRKTLKNLFDLERGHYAYDCEIRLRRQRRMR